MASRISDLEKQVKQSEFKGNPILVYIGNRVHKSRKRKGLSKKELAEKCNISTKTLHAIETANRNYSMYNLLSVLKALNISTLYKRKKKKETEDDYAFIVNKNTVG
jgi:transcriptional regulator with XRE-family HTH domain